MLSASLENKMSLDELVTYCCVELLERNNCECSQAAIDILEQQVLKQVKRYMKNEFLMERV